MRLVHEVRVERNAHHPVGPTVFRLAAELLELVHERCSVLLGRRAPPDEGGEVVQVQRVRHADEPALLHPQLRWLIVVEEVTGVREAVLGEEVEGPRRVRQRGAEPSRRWLARHPLYGGHAVLDDRSLLGFVQVAHVPGVVDTVCEDLPPPADTLFGDLGVVVDHGDVLGDAELQAQCRGDVEEPPYRHAVPVVAPRIVEDVASYPRPTRARGTLRGAQLVEFVVRGDPQRDGLPSWQASRFPSVDARIPVSREVRPVAHPTCPFRAAHRCPGSVSPEPDAPLLTSLRAR